ncbi:MAG TPA: hypothetical protein VK151_00860 [Fluviicola sp.]|nr:hypothetical protein [Fluviicola sp.]
MKKEISSTLKLSRILSLIILFLGALLITFMITVEGELGALPLLLVLTGTVWFVITQIRIRKYKPGNPGV